tara:strand:- start:14297 stop:15034 length:738 start_codon:yes stop_codon:yes gene_type:complete
MFNLKNKNALVTGATGGIGESIARILYNQGAKVCITGTNEDKLDNLNKKEGNIYSSICCDLSNKLELDSLVENVNKKLGQIDILVNNAGITKDQIALRMKDDDWNKVMEINLYSAFILSKLVLKGMMKRKFGRIIQITSVVGFTGNPGQANYAASKSGLIGMSKSLAMEVASRNITVNCIAPGFIDTPMTSVLNDEQKLNLENKIPAKRLGLPKDVATAVIYLASDEASYVNGATIHVNGGLAMI